MIFVVASALPRVSHAFIGMDLFFSAPGFFLQAIRPVRIFEFVAEAKELPTPEEYLREKTSSSFDLFNRIVIAESGWKPDIKNKKSSASGLFQFIDGTFKSQCIEKYKFTNSMSQKNDPYVQIDCAVQMIRDGGLSHWNASKHIWSKSTKPR